MRIRTIIYKEWLEVFRNKLVLITVGILPLVFVITPLVQLAATRDASASDLGDAPAAILAQCQAQALNEGECLQGFLASQFLLLFLILPLAIPVTIASYSIVGEKIGRSLEPLLATPISTSELILGKSLAAVIPAIAATWLSFIVFIIGARAFAASDRVFASIADPLWFITIGLIAPLLTVAAVNVAIFISSRVNDPRAAEQLSTLVMLPILGLFFLRIFGVFAFNITSVLLLGLIVLAIDVVLIWLGVKLFQRETILTRWRN